MENATKTSIKNVDNIQVAETIEADGAKMPDAVLISESIAPAAGDAANRNLQLSPFERERFRIAQTARKLILEIQLADPAMQNSALFLENLIQQQATLPEPCDIEFAQAACDHFLIFTEYDHGKICRRIRDVRDDLREEKRAKRAQKKDKLAQFDELKKRAESSDSNDYTAIVAKMLAANIPVARQADYFELFRELLQPKKDIFSGKLCTWDTSENSWQPAALHLDRVRSRAGVLEELGTMKFKTSLIDPHFAEFEYQQRAELLVEIPEWDGRDRLAEIADCVHLNTAAGISSAQLHEFFCDWFARAFQRLENPHVQNRIIVFKGSQGLGKDFLISTLCDGLGQFSVNMNVTAGDKDTYLQLHRGMIMKIAEFDKTARTEVSVLKDLITTPDTFIRAPYAEDAKRRLCRCSFIASCNVDDILKDSTGNRRFLVFELEKIRWEYPSAHADRLQILAQGRTLAAQKFRASPAAEAAMRAYIAEKTPEDISEEVAELWFHFAAEALAALPPHERDDAERRESLTTAQAIPALDKVSRLMKMSVRQVQMKLAAHGLLRKLAKGARGYALRPAAFQSIDEEIPF